MQRPLVVSLSIALAACGEPAVEVQEASEAAGPQGASGQTESAEPRLVESADGLIVRVYEEGAGPRATVGKQVRLHYRGTLADNGEVFRSTLERGIPEQFVLGRDALIPGLERALLGMRAGTRAEVHVPAPLAYGDRGLGAIPSGADLAFELNLLSVR